MDQEITSEKGNVGPCHKPVPAEFIQCVAHAKLPCCKLVWLKVWLDMKHKGLLSSDCWIYSSNLFLCHQVFSFIA